MRHRVLAFAVLTLVAIWSEAKYSGQWIGEAQYRDTTGRLQDCEKVYFDISQMCGAFRINSAELQCGSGFVLHLDPFYLEYENQQLTFNGKVIGTVDDKHLSANFEDPKEKANHIINLESVDQKIHFSYRIQYQTSSSETEISGELHH